MERRNIVEISDIINDSSLIGKIVEVRGVLVIEYNRGEISMVDNKAIVPYDGRIRKDGINLRFEGIEDDLGIDVVYLQSLNFRYKIDLKGKIFLNEEEERCIGVEDVYWSS